MFVAVVMQIQCQWSVRGGLVVASGGAKEVAPLKVGVIFYT